MGTRSNSNSSNSNSANKTVQATTGAKAKSKAKQQAKQNIQKHSIGSDTNSEDEMQNIQCAGCLAAIDAKCVKVRCNICFGSFHFKCTGVHEKMLKHFLELFDQTGWACVSCWSTAYSTIHKLQMMLLH